MDTINTYFPRLIAQTLGLTPNDVQPLLAGCTVTAADIFEANEITLPEFNQFLGNAILFSKDPALGLKFGAKAQPYLLGELSFAGINAPNLFESLIGLLNFSALQASYIRFEILPEYDGIRITCHINKELGDTARTQQEVMVLVLQNFIELFLNSPFHNGQYSFAMDKPSYHAQYSQVMHCPHRFNAPITSVFIPNQVLQTPSVFYDELLWKQGKLKCAQLLQQQHARYKDLYSEVVKTFLSSTPPPLPKLPDVAKEFNVSERTLNRRLKEEGASFRGIYSEAQFNWGKQLLLNSSLTIENIASELGYSDSANFRRAFKRASGMSPMTFKRLHK